jgi:hypothetical protein
MEYPIVSPALLIAHMNTAECNAALHNAEYALYIDIINARLWAIENGGL